MSVNIFKLKNLISAESLLILLSKTGYINPSIGSLIDNSTFVLLLILSVINNKGFRNSSADWNECVSQESISVASALMNDGVMRRAFITCAFRRSRRMGADEDLLKLRPAPPN